MRYLKKLYFLILFYLLSFPGCAYVQVDGNKSDSGIKSVSWNTESNQILYGGFDGVLAIRNAVTGESSFLYRTHSPFITGVEWNPNASSVLAITDKTIELLDTKGKEIRMIISNPPLANLAFPEYGPNNIDAKTAKFSPDGKRLALAGWKDGRIDVLDAQTGTIEHTLKKNGSKVSSITWNSDGKYLASAGWDETVRIWDMASGEETAAIKTDINGWIDVEFSPDGKSLAWHGYQSGVSLLVNGKEIKLERAQATLDISWGPDGKRLALLNQNSLDIWNTEKQLKEASFNLRGYWDELFWSSDGKYIAIVSCLNQEVSIWNVQTGKHKHLSGFPFALSPDMKFFAIGAEIKPFQDFQ